MSVKLIDSIRSYPELAHLWVDRKAIMSSLGVDIENRRYTPLTRIPPEELPDLEVKSLMWIEYLSSILGDTEKEYADHDSGSSQIRATVIRDIMAQETKTTATEAKANAEAHPRYTTHLKKRNALKAYAGYLDRLIDNLEKYHYTVSRQIDRNRSTERKY